MKLFRTNNFSASYLVFSYLNVRHSISREVTYDKAVTESRIKQSFTGRHSTMLS